MMNTMITAREANAMANAILREEAIAYVEKHMAGQINSMAKYGMFNTAFTVTDVRARKLDVIIEYLNELEYTTRLHEFDNGHKILHVKWAEVYGVRHMDTIYVEKYEDAFDVDEEDIII